MGSETKLTTAQIDTARKFFADNALAPPYDSELDALAEILRAPDPLAEEPCPTCAARGTSALYVPKAWHEAKVSKLNELAAELAKALEGLLTDIEDYQRINHLGGENNVTQVNARAALAKYRGAK